MRREKKITTGFAIRPSLLREAKKIARDEQMNMSEFIAALIQRAIDARKPSAKPLEGA